MQTLYPIVHRVRRPLIQSLADQRPKSSVDMGNVEVVQPIAVLPETGVLPAKAVKSSDEEDATQRNAR